MSSEIVIEVENLSKCYQIYETPRDRLKQFILPRLQKYTHLTPKDYYREFWAIREVSFSVGKGQVIGILGKNGAGKSTLLQMICGTVSPTDGKIRVNGRVAALLELGAGFNPEFTGTENICMNGQLLGLSMKEIEDKMPAITKFADIGDFINQPVKTYSSGMFARLAFSVAVHVDPDILVVDEALSVGDSWFQHKSMAKMRSLMSKGCSVLFVSHSIDAIRALCHEAIWMEKGRIKLHGDVTSVTNEYMNDVFIEHNRIVLEASPPRPNSSTDISGLKEVPKTAPNGQRVGFNPQDLSKPVLQGDENEWKGGRVLLVRYVHILNSKNQVVENLLQGEPFSIMTEVHFLQPIKNISVGFLIKDQFGQDLTGESIFNFYRHSLDFQNNRTVRFIFSSTMILRGGQSYSVGLRINQVTQWDRSDNIIVYADELAAVFNVLCDPDNPMWFQFKQPFTIQILESSSDRYEYERPSGSTQN